MRSNFSERDGTVNPSCFSQLGYRSLSTSDLIRKPDLLDVFLVIVSALLLIAVSVLVVTDNIIFRFGIISRLGSSPRLRTQVIRPLVDL